MAATKLPAQERKDLDKFTKFLALKAVQIIVQSRLGDKVQTSCKPHTSAADGFSLAIQDIPDISAETNKVLQGDFVTSRLPLCVEISLKTVDGDQMVLENWTLGNIADQCDPSVKVTFTVYNRMSIMLKSLLSVTRVTPAYKLSRRQGSDSYVIYYRIYLGEPQYHSLGDGYKQFRVGQLCGPLGTLYLSVAYRTKMTITPVQAQQETSSIMVKSDHFHSDLSPKHIRYNKQKLNWELGSTSAIIQNDINSIFTPKEDRCDIKDFSTPKLSEKRKVNLNKPMRPGAFVDLSKIRPFKDADFILPEEPPFSWLLKDPSKKNFNYDLSKNDPDEHFNFKDDDSGNLNDEDFQDFQDNMTTIGKKSIWSEETDDDDKFMKELHCPFATAGPVGELATFYRECHFAPPLQSFMENGKEENGTEKADDSTIDISEQLEIFESSLQEYDNMVSSLCQSPNNN